MRGTPAVDPQTERGAVAEVAARYVRALNEGDVAALVRRHTRMNHAVVE